MPRRVHHAFANLEKAKEYHERSLAIRLEKLGAQHVDVGSSYYNLAVVREDQGDLEQAKEYCELALTILTNKRGTEHPLVVTIQDNLAQLRQDNEIEDGLLVQGSKSFRSLICRIL